MRVLYVNPMEGEVNPAIDAIAHGLQHALAEAGHELRMLTADFRSPDCMAQTAAAIGSGAEAGVDAIAYYALDPANPREAVAAARDRGVPVFSFVRPLFPVNGAVLYPNFNHGVLMGEWLAERLPEGARVGIIGGPDTPDDAEEVLGLAHAFTRLGVAVANDATDPQWCNLTDVASGGQEVAARLLDAEPDLTALVPYNDESMLGAAAVLEERGLIGQVRMISRNGSPEAVEKVRAGVCDGTWDLDAPGIGTALGEVIARHLAGDLLEGHLAMSPVGQMVCRDNLDAWRPWSERVRYVPFVYGLEA